MQVSVFGPVGCTAQTWCGLRASEETAIARAGVWAWRGGFGFNLGLVFPRTEVLVAIAFNIRGSDPHAKHTLY